jgi:hypothetical protein
MWLPRLLPTLTIAALLTSIPYPGYTGDRFGMGDDRGFRAPIFVPPHLGVLSHFGIPRGGFVRPPFFVGPGVVWVGPPQVVVAPVFVQPVRSEVPVPVPDPKFVDPPTLSAPSTPGSHTVIVQHGSKIEVQSFPVAR